LPALVLIKFRVCYLGSGAEACLSVLLDTMACRVWRAAARKCCRSTGSWRAALRKANLCGTTHMAWQLHMTACGLPAAMLRCFLVAGVC
jgi:hypothetical protein